MLQDVRCIDPTGWRLVFWELSGMFLVDVIETLFDINAVHWVIGHQTRHAVAKENELHL